MTKKRKIFINRIKRLSPNKTKKLNRMIKRIYKRSLKNKKNKLL